MAPHGEIDRGMGRRWLLAPATLPQGCRFEQKRSLRSGWSGYVWCGRWLINMFHKSIRVSELIYPVIASGWGPGRNQFINEEMWYRAKGGLHHTHTQDSGCIAQITSHTHLNSAWSVSDNGHRPNANSKTMTVAHPAHLVC